MQLGSEVKGQALYNRENKSTSELRNAWETIPIVAIDCLNRFDMPAREQSAEEKMGPFSACQKRAGGRAGRQKAISVFGASRFGTPKKASTQHEVTCWLPSLHC
jgi:hypothetical protein